MSYLSDEDAKGRFIKYEITIHVRADGTFYMPDSKPPLFAYSLPFKVDEIDTSGGLVIPIPKQSSRLMTSLVNSAHASYVENELGPWYEKEIAALPASGYEKGTSEYTERVQSIKEAYERLWRRAAAYFEEKERKNT